MTLTPQLRPTRVSADSTVRSQAKAQQLFVGQTHSEPFGIRLRGQTELLIEAICFRATLADFRRDPLAGKS